MIAFPTLAPASIFALLLISSAYSQTTSRWALGRPALLIDMPADPSAGGVAWAERSPYSIFPNNWSAESGGLKIEVARIYTSKDLEGLFAEVTPKMGGQMTAGRKGGISGRDLITYSNAGRTVLVIGPDAASIRRLAG
ncbi:MAG: hypothetical protein ABL984_03770 [Pyrinomonadaceae bacterium]